MHKQQYLKKAGGDGWADCNPLEGELTAEEVMERIALSHDATFFDLVFELGHLTECDMNGNYRKALHKAVQKLAFWTGKNAQLMEEMLRNSKLYHPVLDEPPPNSEGDEPLLRRMVRWAIEHQRECYNWHRW